jgi:hypothetical protein
VPLFVITVTYHWTVSVWHSSRLWAAPVLLNRQAPSQGRPHEIRVHFHFLLANERKISYTMRLGFLAMAKGNDERGTQSPVGAKKRGATENESRNVSENKRDASI